MEQIKTDLIEVENTSNNTMLEMSPDDIIQLASRADKLINAINTIMNAALKITTENDWVLIGGKPYLQETGASKVRALFGISWQIAGIPEISTDDDGHKTYTFKGRFMWKNSMIEAEGSRSSKDSFFVGKDKKPDQIDMSDVRKSAYTNCINNGIKRILPGLRGIDIKVLQDSGLDTKKMQGYTFKEGSQGGKSKSADESGIICEDCKKAITQKVASYSQANHGKALCMDCQKNTRKEVAEHEGA